MITDAVSKVRVVLDTNIIISAILFGGVPREVLLLALTREITAISSPVLLAELQDILAKKFKLSEGNIVLIIEQLARKFVILRPTTSFNILADEPDNRVLEAAIAGNCSY